MPLTVIASTEPIQSRCAVLRYSKLSDAQILTRLLDVCDKEGVSESLCGGGEMERNKNSVKLKLIVHW